MYIYQVEDIKLFVDYVLTVKEAVLSFDSAYNELTNNAKANDLTDYIKKHSKRAKKWR